MTENSLTRISQGQLNLLATCPPMFEKTYLQQLKLPTTPEAESNQNWGSRFHLLMQQRELNLPIESILAQDPEMKRSLQALMETAPQLFDYNLDSWRDAEHCRTLSFSNYLLTVIYDLLIITQEKAEIIDWKTYLKPAKAQKLAKNWQTRLYLYVLAETSTYLPEEISLTYWFVKLPNKPKSLTFRYSESQHQQTKEELTHLLEKLTQWLEAKANQEQSFPHRYDCEQNCPYFSSLVSQTKQKAQAWSNLVSETPEIEI